MPPDAIRIDQPGSCTAGLDCWHGQSLKGKAGLALEWIRPPGRGARGVGCLRAADEGRHRGRHEEHGEEDYADHCFVHGETSGNLRADLLAHPESRAGEANSIHLARLVMPLRGYDVRSRKLRLCAGLERLARRWTSRVFPDRLVPSGPVAQLGARFHGMEEVIGSIPIRSTKHLP